MSKAPEKPQEEKKEAPATEPLKCGVVMPLSECDNCPSSHWTEVLGIIKESLEGTPFKAEMVSEDSVSNILQARIVGNLFKNEMVICDVSGRNPNVMLELGLRLAFDKPVIVIKDDVTPYSFDTSPIEHLGYPRSLRYSEIGKFKEKLKEKVLTTYNASTKTDYRSFLSHFAQYTPKAGTLPESEVPMLQLVQKELSAIREEFSNRRRDLVVPDDTIRLISIEFHAPEDMVPTIHKMFQVRGCRLNVSPMPDKPSFYSGFLQGPVRSLTSKMIETVMQRGGSMEFSHDSIP